MKVCAPWEMYSQLSHELNLPVEYDGLAYIFPGGWDGVMQKHEAGSSRIKERECGWEADHTPSWVFLRLLYSQSVLLYMKGFDWGINMENGVSFFPGLAIQLEKTHEWGLQIWPEWVSLILGLNRNWPVGTYDLGEMVGRFWPLLSLTQMKTGTYGCHICKTYKIKTKHSYDGW